MGRRAQPREHVLPLVDTARPDLGWVHPPSGAIFLRGWERVTASGVLCYDEAAHDVSVRYSHAAAMTVSAYVFPIAPDGWECSAESAFVNAVQDMLRSLDRPRAGEETSVAFGLPGRTPLRGRRVRAVGTPKSVPASTSVVIVEMYARDGWAVKLRSTSTLRASELTEQFFEQWLLASRLAER